jgi:hypothetical protein
MAWARLDDNFHDHPKVDGCSLAAIGLWTLCWSWAHRHRRAAIISGHIPEARVRKIAGKGGEKLAAELVAAHLWEIETAVGGWVFHDFEDYLPKERDPNERREAGKKGAATRWQPDGKLPSPSHQRDGKPVAKGMASDSSRGSAPAFPSRPVPSPTQPEDQKQLPPAAADAQTLVGEFIDACPNKPPQRVVGQVAQQVGQLLGEGINPDHVRAGLRLLVQKPMHPSSLPSLVNQAMNAQPVSTTTQRVNQGLALVEHFRKLEGEGA